MAIKTPTINKIIRMNEFDLLRTSIVPGNMYLCLDSQKLYYDETTSKRVVYNYTSVKTINDLLYNITPSSGTTYYCWEDNSLWLWMNKWIALYSTTTYPSAYVYDSNRNLSEVYRYDQPNIPADDNGLLKDGSVVVRDRNRIIKGKIYINDANDNMTISSFLGGGIRFLPNGKLDTDGELLISDDGNSFLRSKFTILNNELYVDYTEKPELDTNEFSNNTHKYQVFHEGNLDVSAIKVLTPQDIYNKLLDPSLPNPLGLNVNMLNGKTGDQYTLVGHKHIATDISDFNDKARAQSEIKIKEIFSNMTGEGIDISYDSANSTFIMSANTFEITFDGGITGTAKVNHLGNTTAEVIVNPARHVHQNYIDSINELQDRIDGISSVDPTNYYNKEQVDIKISDISGTDVPTSGKPLLVNDDLILPGTSDSTNKLKNAVNLKLTGAIIGEILTDLSSEVIITTYADNILSSQAVEGKAVAVDAQGNLPVNSTSASKLNHTINLLLEGEASGNVEIDTSLESATLNVTLVPGDNILQTKDLGVSVATLDATGKVPSSQLPASQAGLVPMGLWNPETGAPSENPADGYFWICDTDGSFEGHNYQVDDWCLWYNSAWHHINTEANVMSVNGKEGVVVLTAEDIGALTRDYINYNIGETIPANKIVMTSLDGIIEGASVTKLSDVFNILVDEYGDIALSADSISTSTDGSKDLDIKLEITENGLAKIKSEVSYEIYDKTNKLSHRPNIVFNDGFDVLLKDNEIEINTSHVDVDILHYNPNFSEDDMYDFILNLQNAYDNRLTQTTLIIGSYQDSKDIAIFQIDEYTPDAVAGNNLILSSLLNQDYGEDLYALDGNEAYLNLNIKQLLIHFDADLVINLVTSGDAVTHSPKYLATDATVDENTNPFIPTYACQPATKAYVDAQTSVLKKYKQTIGDGAKKSFLIEHNLNTEDIIVQIRDANTKEQVFCSNTIISENSVQVDTDTIISTDALEVIVVAF